jgi:small subunit ribosomal protein S21
VNDTENNNNKPRKSEAPVTPELVAYSEKAERPTAGDRPKVGAMEVAVDHNIEKAIRVLKRKLIKEGLFRELKARRYYEKPSVRRKRKEKEAQKKARKDEFRKTKGIPLN